MVDRMAVQREGRLGGLMEGQRESLSGRHLVDPRVGLMEGHSVGLMAVQTESLTGDHLVGPMEGRTEGHSVDLKEGLMEAHLADLQGLSEVRVA